MRKITDTAATTEPKRLSPVFEETSETELPTHTVFIEKMEDAPAGQIVKNSIKYYPEELVQHYRDITLSMVDFSNPIDWMLTFGSIAAGAVGAVVFIQPVLDLTNEGPWGEEWMWPFLTGTYGSNLVVNSFFIASFLQSLRLLFNPILSTLGIQSDGWSYKKLFTVLINATFAATPLAMLGYKSILPESLNFLMIPIQFLIFTTLQYYGTTRIYDFLFSNINPSDQAKMVSHFLDHYSLRLKNLKEAIQLRPDAEFLISMAQNHRTIAYNDDVIEKNKAAAQLLKTFLNQPELGQSRKRPMAYKIVSPIAKISLSAVTLLTLAGYFWVTLKDLRESLQNDSFALSITIHSMLNFGAVVCIGCCDLAEDVIDAIYKLNKDPIFSPDQQLVTSNGRFYRALRTISPHGMAQYSEIAAGLMITLGLMSTLSWAASLDLQNVAVDEWDLVSFMKHPEILWSGAVVAISIIFNFFASPTVSGKISAVLTSSRHKHENIGSFQAMLDSLQRQPEELELAGPENVLAMLLGLLGIPYCSDRKQIATEIDRIVNKPELFDHIQSLLMREEVALKSRSEYKQIPESDTTQLSVDDRVKLALFIQSKVKPIQASTGSSYTSGFFKTSAVNGHGLGEPLLNLDQEPEYESSADQLP